MQSPDNKAERRLGQVIGGRWTLERVLGSGGTAVVYAAHDSAGARAALKMLHPDMSARPDVHRRFAREAGTATRVNHPGVVQVIDENTESPDSAYIAMELLEGEGLDEKLDREGQLPLDALLEVVDHVLDVLVVAHAQGVVHRDLKPANVFITSDGRVKVLDFGVARLLDPGAGVAETQQGITVGTVPYMAPEQALGKRDEIDGRTDLFSLGAMMFRLISGRRIHETETETDLLSAMASKPAPPLASVAPQVAPGVAAVVDLALGFSKDARYPDAQSMQEDIRALRAGAAPRHANERLGRRELATVLGRSDAPPAPASPDQALVGQTLAERYRIEQLLGTGGMGAVYRAEHVLMRKAVAIKVLHREMTAVPEVVARFEREAVAAARIDHKNVATAKDFGRLDDGAFYLVLEFVQGQSLRKALHEGGAFDVARALKVARQVAQALAAAHAAGIVHRDLKPENVMLVQQGGEPDFVKVLDFGIAKLSAEDAGDKPALTRVGAVFGTPEYMSPEQAMGQPVDARSDLYTVGILLYEMLVGTTPFGGDGDGVSVLSRQMTEAPPPLPAAVPAPVAELVMALLAKIKDQRIQTADELVARIEALAGLPEGSRRVIETGDTIMSLPGAALAAAAAPRVVSESKPLALATQTVRIFGRQLPVWLLAILGFGAVLLLVLVVGGIAASGDDLEPLEPPPTADLTPQLADAVKKAWTGDEAALKTLEAGIDSKRSEAEWLALAHGYAENGDIEKSLKTYESAVRHETGLRSELVLLRDVRRAIDADETRDDALALASTKLGSAGPDVLFDVAEDDPDGDVGQKAAKLLETRGVNRKLTPALRIAIDLRKVEKCSLVGKLLPRAVRYADTRSLPPLRRLDSRSGCGFLGLGDCYECLRDDDALRQAIEAAEAREAPKL